MSTSQLTGRTLAAVAVSILVALFLTFRQSNVPVAQDFQPKPSNSSTGIRLYGFPPSTCTRRVALVLKEKGVNFELVTIDLSKGEHKAPTYLETMQPFGVVPVLEDNGFFIYESRAISRYIALKYANQGTPLIPPPTDLRSTAMFEQAASIEQNNFDPYASGIASERIFKGSKGDLKRAEQLLDNLRDKLEGYERILSKQQYLAGDVVTLADLFHLPYGSVLSDRLSIDIMQSKPNIARWWNDISSRPSWKAVQRELVR